MKLTVMSPTKIIVLPKLTSVAPITNSINTAGDIVVDIVDNVGKDIVIAVISTDL